MDLAGARELARRIAEEERRRAAAAGEEIEDGEGTGAAVGALAAALGELQQQLVSMRTELAARDDAIARLQMELDEKAGTAGADGSSADQTREDDGTAHLLFVANGSRYGLLLRDGPVPDLHAEIVLTDAFEGRFRVCKVGRSPLPGDPRRCAFLEPFSER